MKRYVSVAVSIGLALSVMLFAGCSKSSGEDALKLEDGILTWETVKDAASYEVDMGAGGKSTEKTTYDLASACTQEGEFTVTVRSVDPNGEREEIGSMDISVSALEEPVIGVKQSEDEIYFNWVPVEGATSYLYDAHDGKGLQVAEESEDGDFKVPITESDKQVIRVIARGTSEGNQVIIPSESTYTYESDDVADMSVIGKYPAVYVGDGETQDVFRVGTTLNKGVYEFNVIMYAMDSNGGRLSGNGMWGRRIVDQTGKHVWLCENAVTGHDESAGTIPAPNKKQKIKMTLTVDRGGNVLIPVFDFKEGDRLVVEDITYGGKSILNAKGGKENPVEEIKKLDVSNLDNYLAVFRSNGDWYTDATAKDFQVEVPVNLSDGTHTVQVSYLVCAADGDVLTGNGMWGRRIAGADVSGSLVWLNEYDISSDYKAVKIPNPTEVVTSKFSVEVKNGKFALHALDFNKGELLLIKGVKTATVPKGNGVFVSDGRGAETFKVKTTLTGLPRKSDVTLKVTYKVHDIFGSAVSGNGSWGRRMEVGGKLFWFCEDAVTDHPEAKATIPAANKKNTEELFFYEINKYGVITLNMYDFEAGDVVEITSIKYNGKEILKK